MADLYSDIYGDIYGDIFTAGTGPSDGLNVEVDWNRDGDFSDPGENVTQHVRAREDPITLTYGREPGTSGSAVVQGQGGFTLDNRSRRYSSRNTASLLYGLIKPARPVRISRNIGGSTYILFRGHTDETPMNPDPSSRTIAMSLVDNLADFRGQTISTAMYRGIRTGEAINIILDACDVDPGLRDIDKGATVIPFWWEDDTDALTAIDKLVRSEGSPALFTAGTGGEVVFRDRHHRLTRTASTTSQTTFRNKGRVRPVMARPGFSYDDAWQNIVNRASLSVDQRQPQPASVVWSSPLNVNVPLFSSVVVWAKFDDPVINAVTPTVANGDIVKAFPNVVGNVNATLLSTSGQTIGISLTAGLSSTRVASIQLRAQPVTVVSTSVVSATPDAASNADYGPKEFGGDAPWCGVADAQAICDQQVDDRAQPLPVVKARFVIGRDATAAAALLSRDLSDRVTVQEDETFLNDPFYIEAIQHDLSGPHDHEVTFSLELVPPSTGNTLFKLGTSLLGGTDVLAR